MANSVLAKMAVQISANTADFSKALKQTQSDLSGFQKNLTGLASTLGVAFGTEQVLSFAFEISKLAGEADGVKRAFDKLPNSIQLMQELTSVTAGTVSELELMKRTVQASNFGISLSALPKLLEFAAVRAQQTGQSVDYLVDSIVTGIGRKSPLILDNLGISAVALKEKLGGVSTEAATVGQVAEAVGKIAEESLTKMGSLAETTSTKVQRLSASWENFKVQLGKTANESGVLNFMLDLATKAVSGSTEIQELTFAINEFNRYSKEGEPALGLLDRVNEAAAAAGKKIIILKDEATGVSRAIIDIRSTPIQNIATDSIKATKEVKALKKALKEEDPLTSTRRKAFEVSAVDYKSKQGFTDPLKSMFGLPTAEEMQDRINSITAPLVSGTKYIGEQIEFNLAGPITSGIATLSDAFGQAMSGVGNFGTAILKSVIAFARQFGEILVSAGIAALAAQKLIKNPALAIGAGAALIAIAGAASAALSNTQNRTFGGGGSGSTGSSSSNSFERSTNVQFEAQFVIDGRNLVAVVDKNSKLDRQRRG